MAKKQGTDPKAATAARIKRTEAYAEKVRLLFAQTVNDILALNKTMPKLDDGVMFSFDGESLKKQKEVEALLRRLHSAVTMAIREGVSLEWAEANAEADKLIKSVFGQRVLDSPEFSAWTQRNTAARDAFLERSEKGLNLSDRVWKSVSQLRDEMEVAMTVSMGEGKSASAMSREVRQYLNDPDLMFRRFRYKKGEDADGNPIYGRKWKKRVKDEATGKYKWIDYDRDSYKTGAGVYKSSAKNAMRLTRTETNIAYRRADHERWQQMDFVLGQRVQLSKNHPRKDICDKLQGDYPKEFVFDGWHPQCFCFVTPILMDEEEMAKVNEAFLKGEKYIPKGKRITEYPDSFKDWVREHAEDIADARDRGTEPYFIRNNAGVIDEILDPKPKELSIAEKAALRHAARTPEQREAIIREYNERKATRKYGERILGYMDGISDVDTTALRTALKGGDMSAIMVEAQKLKSIGKEILALDKLDNPMMVARATSKAEAITINDAVTKRLSRMSTDLDSLKSELEYEIDWVGREGKKRYPGTYKYSQDAYKKELAFVQRKIDIRDVTDSVADALAYSVTTHSKAFKSIADEMKAILSSPNIDLATAKAKATELNDKYNQLKAKSQKAGKIYKSKSIKPETVADLKKRLGSKMPKTLDHLETAIAEYEKTGRYGQKAKQHKAEIEDLMRKLFDTHDLGMNISDNLLESVLNSWFKNTFEVGDSGGYVGSHKTTGKIETSHDRLSAAHELFGLGKDLAKDQLSRREYEKYGNLLDHDILRSITHNTATSYGNVEVRFKKDKVIATWTAGDSLGRTYQPSLVSDPRSCSFDAIWRTPDNANIQTDDLVQFKRDHINSYLELQFHGDLTVDCVESLTYPYDLMESRYSKHLATAKKWKSAGVKIYYIANGKLCQL